MALRNAVQYTQYRGHRLVTAPDVEPATVAQVKSQLELFAGDTAKDDEISLFISAVREQIEALTGVAMITQSWRLTLDYWPGGTSGPWWDGVKQGAITELFASSRANWVELPRYPLQSITTLTADDTAVTVADVFTVDTQQQPGRLVIKRGATWPVVLDNANGIQIQYVAGYGDAPEDVPASLRLAVIQSAAYMFEHRGACSAEDAIKKSGSDGLISAYRVARI